MIGLDLDGTLLNEKKELTPRTRMALRKALDAGVVVLVATGRPWRNSGTFRECGMRSLPTVRGS